MIFHEIYNVYFDAVTRILQAALNGARINNDFLRHITRPLGMSTAAFDVLEKGICNQNKNSSKNYNLFDPDGAPVIEHCPERPLTTVEKRWLKTVLSDPHIKLFDVSESCLEDVEPFYLPEDIVVYDREGNGDPWTDSGYIERFRIILGAMEQGRCIRITWLSRESLPCEAVCRPVKFEYSELDDRMRLWANTEDVQIKIALYRVRFCEMSDEPLFISLPPELSKPLPAVGTRENEQEKRENFIDIGDELPERLVMEIIDDERSALERAFFHFSHFQKQEIVPISEHRYRLVMSLDRDDREEIVNRVIAFGPLVRVIEPQWLADQVKGRLEMQLNLLSGN